MTQQEHTANVCTPSRRKAPLPVALYHFHLTHVESQSGNREGYFPLHKYLIVVFLEAMFDQDKVSSKLYHFHTFFGSGTNCKAIIVQISSSTLPHYKSKQLRFPVGISWLTVTECCCSGICCCCHELLRQSLIQEK